MSGVALKIIAYEPALQETWNEFVRAARNGHFMLERGYMDYHADRFQESSLLIYREGRLVALLPAHRQDNALVSHGGLPFAGLVAGPRTGYRDLSRVFKELPVWMRSEGLRRLVYTPTPVSYHTAPFEDDLFLLNSVGARCTRMKLSSGFLGLEERYVTPQARYNLRKAESTHPCEFVECNDVELFWSYLERALMRRHRARPLHTVEEMKLLKQRFPENIRLYLAEAEGEVLGGMVLYLTSRVQRCQYLFRNKDDNAAVCRRLTLWLADKPELRRHWIDLGTSMEPSTGEVDELLLFSKETTGARGSVIQTWTWDIP